jgi:hypothetical protein
LAALPFLQNTVIGDMFWTTLLFGAWWTARLLLTRSVDFRTSGKLGLLPLP